MVRASYTNDLRDLKKLCAFHLFVARGPQTFAVSTADIARAVARAHGRHVLFARFLDPLVRAMGGSGTVRRAFGDFCYREDMADHGFAPGTLSLEECVLRTEEGHG